MTYSTAAATCDNLTKVKTMKQLQYVYPGIPIKVAFHKIFYDIHNCK